MQLHWFAKNKYKLMLGIVGLYLLSDVWIHKGQTRVLFPKKYSNFTINRSVANNSNNIINKNKNWKKAVNTISKLNLLDTSQAGFECDVYFDKQKNDFEVYHDWNNKTGLTLSVLLKQYQIKRQQSSIWLDFKNLTDSNAAYALKQLISLRSEFKLFNKLLVESNRADLLIPFNDSGFFTSYYTPMFNPYLISEKQTKQWVDSITTILATSKVNALSGYYFQYQFLHYFFPGYPILIWSGNDRFSIINYLYQRKINSDPGVFITLYP